MANMVIRYMNNVSQISTLTDRNEGGYGYLEVLFIGVARFSSNVRGKKFFWWKDGKYANPFDECQGYLGKLSSGKWISDEDYTRFMDLTAKAWDRFAKSQSPSEPPLIESRTDYDALQVWSDPVKKELVARLGFDLGQKARELNIPVAHMAQLFGIIAEHISGSDKT